MESADRNAQDVQQNDSAQPILSLKERKKASPIRHDVECYRCRGKHLANECRFKGSDCHNCGKKGHFAKVCKSKTKFPQGQRKLGHKEGGTHLVMEDIKDKASAYTLFTLSSKPAKPIVVTVRVKFSEWTKLPMEVDTGASLSLNSEATYNTLWPESETPPLRHSSVKLQTYTKQELNVLGALEVYVSI